MAVLLESAGAASVVFPAAAAVAVDDLKQLGQEALIGYRTNHDGRLLDDRLSFIESKDV